MYGLFTRRDAGYDRGARAAFFLSLNPQLGSFRAPEPLPIQNPSNFVPKNGFPVVKGLSPLSPQKLCRGEKKNLYIHTGTGWKNPMALQGTRRESHTKKNSILFIYFPTILG